MTKQTFVVLAYMAIWGGLALYVAGLARRQARVARQIEALRERLGRGEE
ncbi:CcmD family protein [Deferrisoma camini]|nr:CcmD family protein [Deferrisoma camini]NOY44608.1 CcmD family protein [Deltaproteobacteria bacterium]